MTGFAATEPETAFERFRDGRRPVYRCPACRQTWISTWGLKRHMAKLHHRCRFCTRAYIAVDHHEKRSHTNEYAIAAGACLVAAPGGGE